MPIVPNLTVRIIAILTAGFVLLQLGTFAVTTYSGPVTQSGPNDLPHPAALAAMATAIEQSPAGLRSGLLQAFNGSLYTVTLARRFPQANAETANPAALENSYGATLEGRRIEISGRRPLLGGLARRSLWPGRMRTPLTIAVGLSTGEVLIVDSRPSNQVRTFLKRRAVVGLAGGLIVLIGLSFAVRQSTRPLLTLSRNIRAFAGRTDTPPLPVEGPRELRELAEAYNDMKKRIAGLVAERTRILAAVAHDMRTYLTRLRLRMEFIDDETQRARATADLGEMAALLDDTLLFAGGDGTREPLVELDIGAELQVIVEVRREIGDAVTLSLPPCALTAQANRLSLRRMVDNLIDNGLRHGKVVSISATAEPEQVLIDIWDDGPGVSPDALPRLGLPFQRLDPSRDRETGGAGLGLAIVRALAARLGATVAFSNRKPHGFAARIVFAQVRKDIEQA